jgi:hypothetical protein
MAVSRQEDRKAGRKAESKQAGIEHCNFFSSENLEPRKEPTTVTRQLTKCHAFAKIISL